MQQHNWHPQRDCESVVRSNKILSRDPTRSGLLSRQTEFTSLYVAIKRGPAEVMANIQNFIDWGDVHARKPN
jgi:hypothetical protein